MTLPSSFATVADGGSVQHLENVVGQPLLDLPVARDRLRDLVLGFRVPVVLAAVSHEVAAQVFDRTDQIDVAS